MEFNTENTIILTKKTKNTQIFHKHTIHIYCLDMSGRAWTSQIAKRYKCYPIL